MFWGWFSWGDDRGRWGGGCLFLPLFLFCGSFYLFSGFNSRSILPLLLLGGLLLLILPLALNRVAEAQKRKNDFAGEKPKHSEYLAREDDEILEAVEPREDDEETRR